MARQHVVVLPGRNLGKSTGRISWDPRDAGYSEAWVSEVGGLRPVEKRIDGAIGLRTLILWLWRLLGHTRALVSLLFVALWLQSILLLLKISF